MKRTVIAFLVASYILAPHAVRADQAESSNTPQLQYERYKLSNGLEVILHEDHKLPIVAVNIWYHVGPVKERAGRTGFAHLFEHMMFEGSKHVGEKAHIRYLESAGATDINATTWFDRTNYFETVPTNQLETALWLESDRMGFLLDTLDRKKLANQRDVVRNERRESTEGRPYGLVDEEVFHQLYPKGHPYYAVVIGSHADIEAARLADVRDFFTNYYAPNNATMVIAGDFNPVTIEAQIEKYFGSIPAGPTVSVTPVVTPPITSERRAVVTDAVQLPKVLLAWLTPTAFAPGDADSEIASDVLGYGKSSRIYRELVYKQQIAQSADCSLDSEALASVLTCEMIAKPGITPEKLEAEADKILNGFIQDGPTQAEVDWARNKEETRMISALERLGGLGGMADTMNYYNQYTGNPNYLPKDLERLDAVTPASVHKIAQQFLGKEHRVVIYGIPGKKVLNDVPRSPEITDADVKVEPAHSASYDLAEAWRATAPKPGLQPAPVLPQPSVFSLSNGLTVFLVERHNLPIVAAQLVSLAGGDSNPANRPGLAGITAAMLIEGTTKHSSVEIADEASRLGTEITTSSDANGARVRISLLSKNVRPGLDLIAESVQHAAFPAADLERVRSNRLTALVQQEDSPFDLALRVGQLSLYGKTSPYGYTPLGSAASLRGLTRDEVIDHYVQHYGPKTSLLELTGDISPSQARELAEQAFGNWHSAALSSDPPRTPASPTRSTVIVDKPGAPQTVLLACGLGQARNSADYPATSVMDTALGGLFSSRINMNLREEHGYTYGAGSWFNYYRGIGTFFAEAQVRTDVTGPATQQLFLELSGIHSKPLSESELRLAKDSIIRSLPGQFEGSQDVNGQLADLWLFHLPIDYFNRMPAQIEAVTSADAQRAAEKYVRPENLLLVAVGDKSNIEGKLAALKLGPIQDWTEPKEFAKVNAK
jgi:zinc protease